MILLLPLCQVTLLAVSRAAFEATFGPLSALQAEYSQWKSSLAQQLDLLNTSVVLGKKHADVLVVRQGGRLVG